mmetsp:Transcript_31612/g.35934  ORF Transcript_31612/g.35934 Transcript_31612/m.35934 type:complete len:133 (+) Transcript_31612:84-482(+)
MIMFWVHSSNPHGRSALCHGIMPNKSVMVLNALKRDLSIGAMTVDFTFANLVLVTIAGLFKLKKWLFLFMSILCYEFRRFSQHGIGPVTTLHHLPTIARVKALILHTFERREDTCVLSVFIICVRYVQNFMG